MPQRGYAKPDNYKLVGWNTAADGSGETYAVNKKIGELSGDITLYGVWAQAMKSSYNSNYPGTMEQKESIKTWDAQTTQKIDSIDSPCGL